MKNPRMQSLRRAMLAYQQKNRSEYFDRGIHARHLYGSEQQPLSWWDDVTLLQGKYRVAFTWRHPRHVYQNLWEDAAIEASQHLFADQDAWLANIFEVSEKLAREGDLEVSPSIKTSWTAQSRLVDICAPIEVRNLGELRELADLVRRLLSGQTTLSAEFPGYVYNKTNWVSEGLADRPMQIQVMPLAV